MLVLTRKVNESIIITPDMIREIPPEGIEVLVVEVQPGRVKIGVNAPRGIRVDRKEIALRIAGERPNRDDGALEPSEAPHAIKKTPRVGAA